MSIFDYYGKVFFEKQRSELIGELRKMVKAMQTTVEKNSSIAEITNLSIPPLQREDLCVPRGKCCIAFFRSGNINHMYGKTDHDMTVKWAKLALKSARRTIEKEDEKNLFDMIGTEKYASVWTYRKKDENAKDNYGTCVNFGENSEILLKQ